MLKNKANSQASSEWPRRANVPARAAPTAMQWLTTDRNASRFIATDREPNRVRAGSPRNIEIRFDDPRLELF